MAKGKDIRGNVTLVCSECKQKNYREEKSKRNTPERLSLNKYCKFCRKRTEHKEEK